MTEEREVQTTRPGTAGAIGFVGLGHMGGSMAIRLLEAGHEVVGTSRTRERSSAVVDAGVRWVDTPREVARAAGVVFTSLPDDRVLERVADGRDGLLAGLDADSTWVDVSTVSPRLTRDLAARARTQQSAMLDAPVSGSVPQVRAGTLTIMVGGDGERYARVEPILRELGTPKHVGGSGLGQALKLAINISLAAQTLALSEGLLLAERWGVNRELALDVMVGSPIGSPALRGRASLMLDPPEDAWFGIGLLRKDVELARTAARQVGARVPIADRAADVLHLAGRLGYDSHDIAALFEVLEQTAREPAETMRG